MKEVNQIGTFKHNDKEYFIYSKTECNADGKVIIYAGYYKLNSNDKSFYPVDSDDELNLVCEILNQLKIKFDGKVDFGITIYNDKKYKMFFDKKTQLRSFYKIDGNNLLPATDEENACFDYKYNYVNDYLEFNDKYKNKDDKKPFKLSNLKQKIKVVVNQKVIMISLCIALAVQLVHLGYEAKIDYDANTSAMEYLTSISFDETRQTEVIEETGKTVATEAILNFLTKNPYVKDAEINLFSSIENFYNANSEFFDLELLANEVTTLQIFYGIDNSKNAAAYYVPDYNDINMFRTNAYDYTEITKHYLFHEYFHSLSNGGLARNSILGRALNEGITETLTCEYTSTGNYNIYTNERDYVRILCELINPDIMLKAYFSGNLQYIIDALCEINSDEDKALRLIKAMDDEWLIRYDKDYKDKGDNEQNSLLNRTEIVDLVKEYFELKNGYSLQEDELMCAFMDSIVFNNLSNCPDDVKKNCII